LFLTETFSTTRSPFCSSLETVLKQIKHKGARQMNYNEAIKILGAKQGDTLDTITKYYRSKVKQSHPDQGGNTRWFTDVRAAFKTILEQYKYNHKSQNEDRVKLHTPSVRLKIVVT
jgi:hypothetical protein